MRSFLKLCLSCMPCPPPARTLTKTSRGITPGAIMDGFTVGSRITERRKGEKKGKSSVSRLQG